MPKSNASIHPTANLCIGGISGAVATAVTMPLDVVSIRTRGTASALKGASSGHHLLGHFKHIYKTEGGFKPFFKGFWPSVIGIVPYRAVYFVTYNQTKKLLGEVGCYNQPAILCAGMLASLTAGTFVAPAYVVKNKMQLNKAPMSLQSQIIDIWKRDKLKGFYRGSTTNSAACLREGMYFLLYENLKHHLSKRDQLPSNVNCMIAAGTARVVGSSTFYPIEVITLQLQQNDCKLKITQIVKNIKKANGFSGFYKGLLSNLLKAIPSTVITFGMYEIVISLCYHKNCNTK